MGYQQVLTHCLQAYHAMMCSALVMPSEEAGEIFHHTYREFDGEAGALASRVHQQMDKKLQIDLLGESTCASGGKFISCSFDGSLLDGNGAGGWVVYARTPVQDWFAVAQASFPVRGSKSSTGSEIVAAMSLLFFLEHWIAKSMPLMEIPAAMTTQMPLYKVPDA